MVCFNINSFCYCFGECLLFFLAVVIQPSQRLRGLDVLIKPVKRKNLDGLSPNNVFSGTYTVESSRSIIKTCPHYISCTFGRKVSPDGRPVYALIDRAGADDYWRL